MKLDLHIHSEFSRDGAATIEEILSRCRALGLSGCAITDHNSMEGSLKAVELSRSFGLVVVRGVEISTADGHVLAYGLPSAIRRGLSMEETVSRIHAAGGIAAVAHVRRFPSGMGVRLAMKGDFDAVETLNGGSSRGSNSSAAGVARRRGLPCIGGSDAHRLDEIGRAHTVIPDVHTEEETIRSILEGGSAVGGRSRTVKETVVYAKETLEEWVKGGFRRM